MSAPEEPRLDGEDTPDAGARELPDVDLDERERRVVEELAREGEALVAFQGLKRRLDLHQQALTRVLRRLERYGLVDRGDAGYRLTEEGYDALTARTPGAPGASEARERDPVTVVQALLPPHVGAGDVEAHLAGRWFNGLRWYGRTDGPGEATLIWHTADDGAVVRVRVGGGAFGLEVEDRRGRHRAGYAAARAVLAALAELYGLDPDGAESGAAGLGVRDGSAA